MVYSHCPIHCDYSFPLNYASAGGGTKGEMGRVWGGRRREKREKGERGWGKKEGENGEEKGGGRREKETPAPSFKCTMQLMNT